MFSLSARSFAKLEGVHPDLVRVVKRAIELSPIDFGVTEGLRDIERQRELKAKGFSKTLDSKHLKQSDGYGHAVDLIAVGDLDIDGDIDAQDKSLTWLPAIYGTMNIAMVQAATELGVKIRWGGTFKVISGVDGKLVPFFDGPHWELV